MDNYFQLPDPEELICYVRAYGPAFPILSLHIPTEEVDYFLTFQQPAYFDAPMAWRGANFTLGTEDEREIIAHRFAVTPEAVEIYRHEALLFKAKVNKDTAHPRTIQILAFRAKLEVRSNAV
jgi:hypothetical protein